MIISVLTTGGTIEKTYNEFKGQLKNHNTIIEELLEDLRLPDLEIRHVPVMQKDSLDMTMDDRLLILAATEKALIASDAVLILHGTDTLTVTGDLLKERVPNLDKPIILTGAMKPYPFKDSDAFQNVTESLLAARLAAPGVYVVMHNRVLPFPGVEKDYETLTFRRIRI